MLLVMPVHLDRISPVLDAARQFLLIEIDKDRVLRRSKVHLDESEPWVRARVLSELGPQLLICGAVSRAFEALLASAGIQVLSNTCGPVEAIIVAFMTGRLTEDAFLMPGCLRRRQRLRHRGVRA
jgi:predicted Fe-Mo cluster-binding NifX family protein